MWKTKIEIPEYVNVEWYRSQKELGKSDEKISEDLDISKQLLDTWKRKIGWKKGDGAKYAGRQLTVNPKLVKELYSRGKTPSEVARILNVSREVINYHFKKFRLEKIKSM